MILKVDTLYTSSKIDDDVNKKHASAINVEFYPFRQILSISYMQKLMVLKKYLL